MTACAPACTMGVKLNLTNTEEFITANELVSYKQALIAANDKLREGTGEGSDYLGWLRLPADYDKAEFQRIRAASERIRKDSKVLLVIGIGGSYLGARAVIEFLRSPNYNLIQKDTPDIFFVGNNLSADYTNELISLIGERDFSVNVISKSGTTTEPAIAFRIFKSLLEQRYGREGARSRIYATTDASKGALKTLACAEGYESFVIPDNVGGRFSVLTAVGLLPIAVAGIDIERLMSGAQDAMRELSEPTLENPAWAYAAARNAMYQKGKKIEVLACYEPSFRFMSEWWKQLYGESEGKDKKGIFPASVDLTADLHSMGQYIQDGERILFETVINIEKSLSSLKVEADAENRDGLNFLAGLELDHINKQAFRGTLLAHVDGGVPNIVIEIPARDELSLGYLIYFFELACGLSGYLLGVYPFNH